MRTMFNDEKYLQEYRERGVFPKIHNEIYTAIIQNIEDRGVTVFDLGSCTGLLSLRLARKFKHVLGIEASKADIERSITAPNVTYHFGKVTAETMEVHLAEWSPKVIVARRVFPEIANGDVMVIRKLNHLFVKYGVEYIAIEGRIARPNQVNVLASVLDEEHLFTPEYKRIYKFNNVIILQLQQPGSSAKSV